MLKSNTPDTSRRKLLSGLGLGGAALAAAPILNGCNGGSNDLNTRNEPATPTTALPELPQRLLVNRERASQVMKQAGIDAIVSSDPRNIYYLTNYFPQLSKMGMGGYAFAILPRDPNVAPVLVEGEFAFYIAGAETVTADFVDVRLHTGFAEADQAQLADDILSQLDAAAIPSFLPTSHNWHPLNSIEDNKRSRTRAMSEDIFASSHIALIKALRDLELTQKSLSVDRLDVMALLRRADVSNVRSDGENLLRTIRLQKSPEEISLMRYAASANAEAGLAAAKLARDGANFQDIRRSYAKQCGERLLTPGFLVIDDVVPDMARAEIKEGRSFLIDCVSHYQYYNGDYGRTVCVGEPTREIQRATKALGQIWDDLLPQLKPGMFYNEIIKLAADIHAKTDTDAGLACNPHSVGINHTDEPSAGNSDYFVKDNLQLLEGMIISVDLPMVETGFGGSAHLEDLVLITSDGAELLNDGGDRVIIV